MREAIRFYCGVSELKWNHHPTAPGAYTCVSPVYGRSLRTKSINRVAIPANTHVIQDSGAFSDGPGQRLSVEAALERQIVHAETFGYASQVTHRASYDLLIDEKWQGGIRHKARWTEADAESAVQETVRAATHLAYNRRGKAAILSAQGVSSQQYLRCAERIVPLMQPQDIFGLGGWCIIGKLHAQMISVFRETMHLVLPFLAHEGIKQVHIWGVCYAPALREFAWLCNEHGIQPSTDSARPSMHPVFGQWGYAEWRDNSYIQPPILDTCKSGEYQWCVGCRGLERTRHVKLTRQWLADFRAMRPKWIDRPKQLSLMEVS